MSKNRSSNKKQRVLHAILITLLVIVIVLLVAVVTAFAYYMSKLDLLQHPEDLVDNTDELHETVNGNGDSDKPDDNDIIDKLNQFMEDNINEIPSENQDMTPVSTEIDDYQDPKVYNIMLFGTDERTKKFSTNARGDSCMMLSLNTNDNTMRLVSFERGMGVPILDGEYKGSYDWLTHVFRYGGADLMMRTIRECFKVDTEYYIRVNFATFIEGITAIGGIDIELTEAEADYINNDVDIMVHNFNLSKGWNHLNGEQALSYARCRQIDSDWRRIERQRKVIQASMNQLKTLNVVELDNALNALLPLVLTNMPDSVITQLLLAAPNFQGKTAEQLTIPAKGTYGGMKGLGGRSLFAVDFDENSRILRNFLYPETASQATPGTQYSTGTTGVTATPQAAIVEPYNEEYKRSLPT